MDSVHGKYDEAMALRKPCSDPCNFVGEQGKVIQHGSPQQCLQHVRLNKAGVECMLPYGILNPPLAASEMQQYE
jgi:hypothetical protein